MTAIVEKRAQPRQKATSRVRVKAGVKSKTCKCVDLSINGCGVFTEDMSLKTGSTVELTFIINLGDVAKLHKRQATVKHIGNGITGFHMVYKAPLKP